MGKRIDKQDVNGKVLMAQWALEKMREKCATVIESDNDAAYFYEVVRQQIDSM